MSKRYLDCTASEIQKMTGRELTEAIAGSEGRILVCETIGAVRPMLGDVTNAEFVSAMGADMIILNLFDVNAPVIQGLPDVPQEDMIREVKRLTGRAVGINLEPLEADSVSAVETNGEWNLTSGRAATVENARKAIEMGIDFIVLTGNPGVGVTNSAIIHTLRRYREEFGDRIMLIAGKINIITEEDARAFAGAGADVILMPAPGTVPGITMEYIRGLVSSVHKLGRLTLTAVGTSQEGADAATIREIALMCKMTGTDLHHLGDSGYVGMALPENILEYGKVIRGVRHTYHRMASSINR